jgi:hypothetical protein
MERENPDYRRDADSGFVFLLRMCRLGTYTSMTGSYRMSPCCEAYRTRSAFVVACIFSSTRAR